MKSLFITVLNMSITGSFVILAIMLARLLIKKAPKKYSYVLWLIPAFRLICPFSFRSVFSIFNLNFLNVSSRKDTYAPTMNFVSESVEPTRRRTESFIYPGGFSSGTYEVSNNYSTEENLMNVLALIWIIGAFFLLVYGMINYLSVKTKVEDSEHYTDNVYKSKNISMPFVLGFIKPNIYLPYNLGEEVSPYVLAHENYHIKRKDHIIKLLAYVVLSVHWFNPFCWLAFFEMTKDMEMSCDEKVLKENEGIKKNYSLVLLSFATGKKMSFTSPIAFGETSVKSRIKNVLSYKKPIFITAAAAAVILLVIAVVFASNPATQKLKELVPVASLRKCNNYNWAAGEGYNTWLIRQMEYESFFDELEDIEISLNPISEDLSESRPNDNYITALDLNGRGFQSFININFNSDFSEVWINENNLTKGNTNSRTYKVLNPEKVKTLIEQTKEQYYHNYLNVYNLEKGFNVIKNGVETIEIHVDKSSLPKLNEIPMQEDGKPFTRYPIENGGLLVYDSEVADVYLTYIMRRYNADINLLQFEFKTVYNIPKESMSIPVFYDYESLYGVYYSKPRGLYLTASDNILYDSKESIENGIENVGPRGTIEFMGMGITAHLDAYMNVEIYENAEDYFKFYIDVPIYEITPK